MTPGKDLPLDHNSANTGLLGLNILPTSYSEQLQGMHHPVLLPCQLRNVMSKPKSTDSFRLPVCSVVELKSWLGLRIL